MTKEECLLRAICREIVLGGVQTDRFTQLWLASGVNLQSSELDIANKILQRGQFVEEVYGSLFNGLAELH